MGRKVAEAAKRSLGKIGTREIRLRCEQFAGGTALLSAASRREWQRESVRRCEFLNAVTEFISAPPEGSRFEPRADRESVELCVLHKPRGVH
jgi:hypothetical protein